MSLYFITFGFLTYYVVPSSIMNGNFGVFFFVLNLILTSICIGMTLISVAIMHNLQKAILSLLLFFKRGDRNLKVIVAKRLDSSKPQNMKIGIMVTVCIAFLMFQTGSQETSMLYFKGIMYWMLAGDILISTKVNNSLKFLNEIPISNLLESFMVE